MSVSAEAVRKKTMPSSMPRGKALVVDDDLTNRIVLKSFLTKDGFEVIEAEDGKQAIDFYLKHKPDIIFMDIMMPVMDGLESSKQIKSINDDHFTPIIFITAMMDNDTISRCIDAGGDDFLTKPVNKIQLKAKIHSMERIRDMHRKISSLNNKLYHEQKVAEHIFTHVVGKSNACLESIHTLLRPLDLFSGDMLLTGFTPSRDIHVLLADFTGHGLSAALGALPASATFHAMTAKGYSIDEILKRINTKLKHLLPTNMFMAAQYVCISHDLKYISVCNCAMPDIVLLNKECSTIKEKIISKGIPLGIDHYFDFSQIIEHHEIDVGDRVILSSDGIIESTNIEGEQFGEQRFEQALISERCYNNSSEHFDNVVNIFDSFCSNTTTTDDISFVEIPCLPENIPPWDIQEILQSNDKKPDYIVTEWKDDEINDASEVYFNFNSANLKYIDPVPLIINHISQLTEADIPRQSLFVILTELYVNALDHGILGLDSSLKSNADGFEKYFTERESELNKLDCAHMQISLKMHLHETGGQLKIAFEDSGPGFNYMDYNKIKINDNSLSGRGISLVRQLCSSVTYFSPGNKVEAIYQWTNQDL